MSLKYSIVKVSVYIDQESLDIKLEEEVNKMIESGWKLFGNITIVPNCSRVNPAFIEVWQPMIKEIN